MTDKSKGGLWYIVNEDGDAWSNEYGWVDNDSYDLFTQSEREWIRLPVEGEWRVWDYDD